MVYPERQRQKDKSRYNSNISPSNQQDRPRRRSRSKSDSKERKRSRQHGQHRENKDRAYHSHYRSPNEQQRGSHSKKRSQSKQIYPQKCSQSEQYYEGRDQQQLQQTIRLGLRNNDLHFHKKAHEAFLRMPERKQQQLNEQARSPEKFHQCILVRELFISGLNDITQQTITQLMGKYGQIQSIEIIRDFAFVKYFRVEDASNACADYHNINASVQPLINSNFKIFFADHLKRWNVVSNHQQYEIREYLIPVIYTSVKNDPHFANQKYLTPIFKKYGFIRNIQMRKNEFPGPKIYVTVQYETLEMALRARDRLRNHRQKFGQKKTQIAILVDVQKITRIFPNVSNQLRYQKKRLQSLNSGGINNMMPNINSYGGHNNLEQYQPSKMMGPMNPLNPIQPMSNPMSNMAVSSSRAYQTQDIFAMLQKLNQKKVDNLIENEPEQDSDWGGFFTRNNQFKVQVDFNRIHKDVPFELQSILNVSHRGDIHEALNRTDYIFAGKFRAANKFNSQNFSDYIKYFTNKNRGGIIFTSSYLIYLLPPKEDLNLPYSVGPQQLLALFFKIKN